MQIRRLAVYHLSHGFFLKSHDAGIQVFTRKTLPQAVNFYRETERCKCVCKFEDNFGLFNSLESLHQPELIDLLIENFGISLLEQ